MDQYSDSQGGRHEDSYESSRTTRWVVVIAIKILVFTVWFGLRLTRYERQHNEIESAQYAGVGQYDYPSTRYDAYDQFQQDFANSAAGSTLQIDVFADGTFMLDNDETFATEAELLQRLESVDPESELQIVAVRSSPGHMRRASSLFNRVAELGRATSLCVADNAADSTCEVTRSRPGAPAAPDTAADNAPDFITGP